MEQEKKSNGVVDLTPDGQGVDYLADDGKSLAEKALQKKPSKEDRKPRVEEKEPTFWERLVHAFWEMFR